MNKKYSFLTIFLIGIIANIIKILLISFALSFVGKVLFRILHEDFMLIVKQVLVSEELYQDTLMLAAIMTIFSLPRIYLGSREYFDKQKE